MFRTSRYVRWPWRWYAFEAWARLRRCVLRTDRRREAADERDRELWQLLAQEEDKRLDALIDHVVRRLERSGYQRRP